MTKIKGFKGFNADWTCRGFQYEVGKTYEHKGVADLCKSGFHACADIRDVWRYYAPAGSRFAKITAEGVSAQKDDDSKFACAKITIDEEISLSDMIELVVKDTISAANKDNGNHATAYRGVASATGDYGAATATGECGAATATGEYGAASAAGYWGAASATGEYGAASATGECGAASATAYRGAAMASGRFGAAMASGFYGRASGAIGNALFLVERNADGKITAVWAGIVGQDGIEPDTFYTLIDGKPEAVK